MLLNWGGLVLCDIIMKTALKKGSLTKKRWHPIFFWRFLPDFVSSLCLLVASLTVIVKSPNVPRLHYFSGMSSEYICVPNTEYYRIILQVVLGCGKLKTN